MKSQKIAQKQNNYSIISLIYRKKGSISALMSTMVTCQSAWHTHMKLGDSCGSLEWGYNAVLGVIWVLFWLISIL
jgi:hypothetical protein